MRIAKKLLVTLLTSALMLSNSVSIYAEEDILETQDTLYLRENVIESDFRYIESEYGNAIKLFDIAYGGKECDVEKFSVAEDSDITVPKSFAINEEGQFYILDTVNSAVKIFSNKGEYISCIKLPESIYGLDLAVLKDYLFVYSDDENLYMINIDDPENYQLVTHIPRPNIQGLYESQGAIYVRSYNGNDKKISVQNEKSYHIDNNLKIEAIDTVVEMKSIRKEGQALSKEDDNIPIVYSQTVPIGASYLVENEDYTYVLSNETNWEYAETRITKFADAKMSNCALTISGKVYENGYPFKKVYIHEDIVYQMLPTEKGLSFYEIPWSEQVETRITDEMVEKD